MENISLGPKTTMRIGGTARYFAELHTKKDVEDIVIFAGEKQLPLVILGGGSNTIFADGMIEAVVAKVVADGVSVAPHPHSGLRASRSGPESSGPKAGPRTANPLPVGEGISIHIETGKILASLLNELAEQNLDLSSLTGIPGTIGGAIFGNAGQGFGGTWIGSFVKNVTFYHQKQWKILSQEKCHFAYRESWFKRATSNEHACPTGRQRATPPILWSTTLSIPTRPKEEIQAEIERLIRRRIETQPHLKTAGSCFKSLPNGTPAWKLIDSACLRGLRVGDIQVAEKHANFLLNVRKASFSDATALVQKIQSHMGQSLDIEMRFIGKDGLTIF